MQRRRAYLASMGIRDDIGADYHASLAALSWLVDLGADEALSEVPICAYDLPEKPGYAQRIAPPTAPTSAPPTAPASAVTQPAFGQPATQSAGQIHAQNQAVALAQARAAACMTLDALDAAAASFEFCDLHKGARGAAQGLGTERAGLLVLCDPPTREAEKSGRALDTEDLALFHQIFASIGLSTEGQAGAEALHIAPVLPWPLRGTPEMHSDALQTMRPFALRRIALVQPRAVVVMGHSALAQILRAPSLMGARGQWHPIEGSGLLALPIPTPQAALKTPETKRAIWDDLLAIKDALRAP